MIYQPKGLYTYLRECQGQRLGNFIRRNADSYKRTSDGLAIEFIVEDPKDYDRLKTISFKISFTANEVKLYLINGLGKKEAKAMADDEILTIYDGLRDDIDNHFILEQKADLLEYIDKNYLK